ncbi:sensor histidine kinase [Chitinophaga sp. 22620]|uniref:sensor histidine kinase n=1 Tax=Chitinophaga sp. 22620 TaxID=3453952 RepID=UPI003F840586
MIRRQTDTFLLLGFLCFMAAMHTDRTKGGWSEYLPILLALLLSQWPALLFNAVKHRLTPRQYHPAWIISFCVCLPLTLAFFMSTEPFGVAEEMYTTVTVFSVSLQLFLFINAWWQGQQLVRKRWWKISFEKGALATLALLSITFATMAVSSMGNPEYHKMGVLLLGFEFSLRKVFTHFGTWLAILAQFMFMYGCGYFIFWFNSRVLVSRVLKERGMAVYCLAGLAAVAVFYPIIGQLLAWLPLNHLLGGIFPSNPFKDENAYSFLALLVVSLPVILALQWYAQNNRIMLLEKEKTQVELDMLKQQINPHFFFNTLNNLYALSLHKSDQTPDVILQLSDLMRYVIYKGQESTVPLGEDVRYLEDYIRLQEIRLKQRLDVVFEKDITRDDIVIAPLLLVVFVENAFKHGIEAVEGDAFLRIYLKAGEKGLTFICENPIAEAGTPEEKNGIGLQNLRKRLALLYPGKHRMVTGRENHTFKAELYLDWS